ncbi:hypothetical protein NE237_012904 [Protea cynaroides]|uniref:KIB1-4 beta-propeller domain-containing protein n=1 Tax=Protea cynaroides TaxID=273540 RepID=A0A9Q0GXM7_9MAGN|nr:hypothetical protein NE237_012904 [Protea cynaroides]
MALSASPSTSSPKDCIVMVIHSFKGVLSSCRPGDEKWIIVKTPKIVYVDILYYKDQFYAVDILGAVFAYVLGDDAIAIQVASPPDGLRIDDKKYVVELSGDMMLVVRNHNPTFLYHSHSRPVGFTVFRLNRNGVQNEWVKVENLGNRALFVGDNSSLCACLWGTVIIDSIGIASTSPIISVLFKAMSCPVQNIMTWACIIWKMKPFRPIIWLMFGCLFLPSLWFIPSIQ